MKKAIIALAALIFCGSATAQLKPRPDAFPPVVENNNTKVINMATTPAEMANWNRYPTYGTYVTMMQQWAAEYPTLCRLDTIGTSYQGRLILSMEITANPSDTTLPEFFYSSTIHGDEVTGYVMMLRLIDTLLRGYGTNPQYTDLMNTTLICINPLANPDGTYRINDNTIWRATRYNSNNVDLNRNYPNPFAPAKETLQQENIYMIDYFNRHNFRLSANLHGGAEVMNYPWDSFRSDELPHPDSDWWEDVCRRFVDTSRTYNANHFDDTYSCGYTAGGDWYVITGGRQDYVNYYYNCLELTMEISSDKTLSSDQLPTYWNFLQHSFVNYIAEVHSLPGDTIPTPEPPDTIPTPEPPDTIPDTTLTVRTINASPIAVYPNPATSTLRISAPTTAPIDIYDCQGRKRQTLPAGTTAVDVSAMPAGIYILRHNGQCTKFAVKR